MKFQRFRLNRIKYLILILLSIVFLPSVKAIVKPTSDFYINDYANILSYETEEYILNRSVALNNVDGTQIVVVTVPNLEGMTLESYATKLFREFGIGNKYKNNGLLLFLALEEREFRVEVGYGLEGILPDGKTGRFQDQYIIPYLKDNNWDEGIKNGYDAFYKEIVTLNNLNVEYLDPVELNHGYNNVDFNAELVLFLTMFSGVIIGYIIRRTKNKVRNTFIYLVIWLFLYIVSKLFFFNLLVFLIIHLVCFIIGRFSSENYSGSSYYGGYTGSRGSSFRSSHSGGGGRSGGGGSSRRF